jgi:hypothetical protein
MSVRGVTDEDMAEHCTKLVWHEAPVDRARQAVEGWTYLDKSYGVGWEKLFLSRISDDDWCVENIPFFSFGLKYGSIVRINFGQIIEVVATPADFAFRVCFVNEKIAAKVHGDLLDTGLVVAHERVCADTIAVQIRPSGKAFFETMLASWETMEILVGWEDVCEQPFVRGPESGFPASGHPDHKEPRVWHPH